MVGDAVSSELFVHFVAMGMCVVSDGGTYLTVLDSWLAHLNSQEHALSCDLRQFSDLRVDISNHDHSRVVSMMAVLEADDVDVDSVAILEHITVRHSMRDLIIHSSAH